MEEEEDGSEDVGECALKLDGSVYKRNKVRELDRVSGFCPDRETRQIPVHTCVPTKNALFDTHCGGRERLPTEMATGNSDL